MARTSARSFNQYSGIDRQRQMQYLPSALERQQDPGKWQSGGAADTMLRGRASWSMPLSEQGATPSGRSFYDPMRQAERTVRGTARPGQLQGAMIRDQLMPQPDQFQQILHDQINQGLPTDTVGAGDTTNYGNAQGQGPLRNPYMGYRPNGRSMVNSAFSRKPSYSFP